MNTTCDIEIAFYGTSLSAKTGQITVVKKFENTLRDLDRLFYCQVDGNVILIKSFDDMRLFRPLRPLRTLRLLRFLMAWKSSSN